MAQQTVTWAIRHAPLPVPKIPSKGTPFATRDFLAFIFLLLTVHHAPAYKCRAVCDGRRCSKAQDQRLVLNTTSGSQLTP